MKDFFSRLGRCLIAAILFVPAVVVSWWQGASMRQALVGTWANVGPYIRVGPYNRES